MDTNTVIEGTVKFRDGKKWKSRWCVVRKLSPVADCLHLQLYRDSKERYKHGQTKASLSLENFLGIQSGFTLDKESNTLAIICQEVIVVLAFDTREHLMQWQVKVSANLGEGDQFLVQVTSAPSRAKLSPGPARLLMQEYQFCLTVGVPPRLVAFWHIRQLRRFGMVEGKFCFEGGSRCGRGEGLYVLVTEKPEELTRAFNLAGEGKLSTRKRVVTRNMSVMEKTRRPHHHSYRPDSRLSDVSSLDSVLESPVSTGQGGCCSCHHSREDLLSWAQSPSADNDSNQFDLKSLWNGDTVMGRCTSCMSKIGSMSRSSTLTHTPCSRFPAWTMDRPKSCGSQKMSPSVTCSSVSLSSHSSRGSSCDHPDHQRHSPAPLHNSSICSGNGSLCNSAARERSHTTPTRPPKPQHLSFRRLQSTPSSEVPPSPSPFFSPVSSPCCCSRGTPPPLSPYGNYDIPKPLSENRRKLKLDLKETPCQFRLQSQSSAEYYDTPRKLKDSLVWDYGNYDIPPPAQPIVSPVHNENNADSETREIQNGSESNISLVKENMYLNLTSTVEIPITQINKVKLTGEGRMPVMSPCGKIIEIPEPTYEEKLDNLLENNGLNEETNTNGNNYANLEINENLAKPNTESDEKVTRDRILKTSDQNYSNISVVQSLENYENFKYFFSEQSLDEDKNKCEDVQHETVQCNGDKSAVCCLGCGYVCRESDRSEATFQVNKPCKLDLKSEIVQLVPNQVEHKCRINTVAGHTFLNEKCNSTSCLQDIKSDCGTEQSGANRECSVGDSSLPKGSVSAANSPALKRVTRQSTMEQALNARLQLLRLRKRSNSAESARLHNDDESVNDTISVESPRRSYVLSTPSSTNSLSAIEKLEDTDAKKGTYESKNEMKLAPLVISESTDQDDVIPARRKFSKQMDLNGAKRSSSVPNKFFSNRDSSSSNDSGVSTGSLSLRHFGTDFLEFEMPLTTSMSSKRHHIAMINTQVNNNDTKHTTLPKRSKSVDPLRDLTFKFGFEEPNKSTSAEAEVPICLLENANKDYLSPRKVVLSDSRSTSSGTSDMSDYYETLSFSSFSSLDAPDNYRYGRTSAPTMKPRSGNEYQKIDRYLLEQETKQ